MSRSSKRKWVDLRSDEARRALLGGDDGSGGTFQTIYLSMLEDVFVRCLPKRFVRILGGLDDNNITCMFLSPYEDIDALSLARILGEEAYGGYLKFRDKDSITIRSETSGSVYALVPECDDRDRNRGTDVMKRILKMPVDDLLAMASFHSLE